MEMAQGKKVWDAWAINKAVCAAALLSQGADQASSWPSIFILGKAPVDQIKCVPGPIHFASPVQHT